MAEYNRPSVKTQALYLNNVLVTASAEEINAIDELTGDVITTTSTSTLSNKTLTTPIVVTTGSIVDAGGAPYVTFVEDATPTDSIQITQGDTTLGATIESITTDTNADLLLDAAGTGDVVILDGTELTFRRATFNALIVATDQTGEDHTFTIPDIATGTSDTFAFLAEAQTLSNKTLTTPIIVTTGSINDAGGSPYITFVEDATPTDSVQVTQGDTTLGAKIESVTTDTNADLLLDAAGTGDVVILNGTELTFRRATFDALVVATDQTGEDHTFTIPDIATGASDTFALLAEAQTLTNKTLTTPIIVTTGAIHDAGGAPYVTFVESATPTDSVQVTQGDTTVGATVESITTDTNADLLLDAAGTGDVTILNGTELTFRRATQDALVVVADQTGEDHTFNIPDIATGASDTFAFLAESQTLTNKTLTSPVINTGVSGTAVLDDDSMATASATTLSTSESIKAYVDSGRHVLIQGEVDNISAAASTWTISPVAGDIIAAYIVIDGAVTLANAVITFEIATVAATGDLTVVHGTSAAGATYSQVISGSNTVAAGQDIEILTDGGSTDAAKGTIVLVIEGVPSTPLRYVQGEIADVSTLASSWTVAPIAGTITNIWTVIDGTIATAPAVITFELGGTAITGSSISITDGGSAAGDVDTSAPSALNVVAAGDSIEILTSGASTNAVKAEVLIEITPS